MDIIKKKICLEPFISRFDSKHSFINENGKIDYNKGGKKSNWGKIPIDVILDDRYSNLIICEEELPLTNVGENYILRYGNMIKWYSWLNDFYKTTDFFVAIKNYDEINGASLELIDNSEVDMFSEDSRFSSPSVVFYEKSGDITEIECGNIVGINVSANTFNSIFRKEEDGYRTDIEFINMVKDCFDGKIIKEGELEKYVIQHFSIPIYIDSDYDNCGALTSYMSKWQPYKDYVNGDVVFYEDIKSGESGTYVLKMKNENESVLTGKSYFNEDDGWEPLNLFEKDSKSVENVKVPSKLNNVRRTKSNAVDDNGNSLPFIIDNEDTSIPFMVGYSLSNDGSTVDVLKEVIFSETSTGKAYTARTENEYITYSNIKSNLFYDDYGSGNITFKYIIGAIPEKNAKGIIVSHEGGIEYEDTFAFEMAKIENVAYNGSTGNTFNYIDIKYENIDNFENSTIFSNVTYNCNKFNENNGIATFKNEELIGIEWVNEKIDIDIDRGKASLFERMNILGEVNTFDDLKNYKNNYFDLQ